MATASTIPFAAFLKPDSDFHGLKITKGATSSLAG
jgi:hypothetical protein